MSPIAQLVDQVLDVTASVQDSAGVVDSLFIRRKIEFCGVACHTPDSQSLFDTIDHELNTCSDRSEVLKAA
jgi:hypothetical protein